METLIRSYVRYGRLRTSDLLQVTYEAHKEYLAKMYEEYQRQEEENIKKGKKGLVSTISGLSAQASGIKGAIEIREMDDTSQTPESETEYENADSCNLLAEGKVLEATAVDGVRVEVHDLLVDIKAEKVEATEVKLDDMDLTSEPVGVSENGALVEVDSLMDDVYCAAVETLNIKSVLLPNSNLDQNTPPLITLDEGKDSISDSNDFLFGKEEEKLVPDPSPLEPLVLPGPEPSVHSSSTKELDLLGHVSSSSELGSLPSILEKDECDLQAGLQGFGSLAQAEASSGGSEVADGSVVGSSKTDAAAVESSSAADAERPGEGKDKSKKIQTTATTQVRSNLNLHAV